MILTIRDHRDVYSTFRKREIDLYIQTMRVATLRQSVELAMPSSPTAGKSGWAK